MRNFTILNDWLAIGGDLSPRPGTARLQIDSLVSHGVIAVVDLRDEWDDHDLWEKHAPQVTTFHIGTDDRDGYHIPDSVFSRAFAFVVTKRERQDGLIYVHCHMGVNRSPSVAMALLMALDNMGPVDAFQFIRSKRPVAGIAYASDAVAWVYRHVHRDPAWPKASEILKGAFDDWMKDYWTPDRIKGVNDFIKGERKREATA